MNAMGFDTSGMYSATDLGRTVRPLPAQGCRVSSEEPAVFVNPSKTREPNGATPAQGADERSSGPATQLR